MPDDYISLEKFSPKVCVMFNFFKNNNKIKIE